MTRGQIRAALALMSALALTFGCGGPRAAFPGSTDVRVPETLRIRSGGRIVTVPFEEYVLASVLSEVTPLNETPATIARIYDVQAVIARTYAAAHVGRHAAEGFDLCDSTHCQLYEPARIQSSRFAADARAAVERTAGVMLVFDHRPAETLFHADCGGFTAAADTVWGGAAVPYLIAAPDDAPSLVHRAWRVTMTLARLRAALNANPRSRVGNRFDGFRVTARDAGGRVETVVAGGELSPTLRGEELRSILNQTLGQPGIQSTRFAIASNAGGVTFDGSGFGHGVGLCQRGAAARARDGDSLQDILWHYFPGTTLQKTLGVRH